VEDSSVGRHSIRKCFTLGALLAWLSVQSAVLAVDQSSDPCNCVADPPGKHCLHRSRAVAWSNAGFHAAAKEELNTYLKHCSTGTVPAELRYLGEGWNRLYRWAERTKQLSMLVVPTLGYAFGLLFVILAAYRLVAGILNRGSQRHQTLHIGTISAEGGKDGVSGVGFSQLLREKMQQIGREPLLESLRFVTKPIQAVSIPKTVVEELPSGKPAGWFDLGSLVKAGEAVVNWLFPSNTMQLSGELQPHENQGMALSLRLSRVGRSTIEHEEVLQVRDFLHESMPPAAISSSDQLELLAEVAAVWLMFSLNRDMKFLGTSDWNSCARFRAALLAEGKGCDHTAKALYISALKLDERFHGARMNLFNCLLKLGEVKPALEQLERAAADSAGDAKEPTMYAAQYMMAALDHNQGGEHYATAERRYRKLLSDLDDALAALDTPSPASGGSTNRRRSSVREQLRSIMVRTEVALGTTLVAANAGSGDVGQSAADRPSLAEGRDLIMSNRDSTAMRSGLQYNLACGFARLATVTPNPVEQKELRRLALLHLERCLSIEPGLAPTLRMDADLALLREDSAGEFDAIVLPQIPAATASLPPGRLELVGCWRASRLAAYGISDLGTLRDHVADPGLRAALAKQIGEPEPMLLLWQRTLEMVLELGLTPAQANRLKQAAIYGREELAAETPEGLQQKLINATPSSQRDTLPAQQVLEVWTKWAQQQE
jgi:tetratricopeptide (TPR) repeat protein